MLQGMRHTKNLHGVRAQHRCEITYDMPHHSWRSYPARCPRTLEPSICIVRSSTELMKRPSVSPSMRSDIVFAQINRCCTLLAAEVSKCESSADANCLAQPGCSVKGDGDELIL
eukprot:scaffold178499_cov30-Tisochrysis_lutea.AAC.11